MKFIFIYETLPEIITRVIPREIGQNDKNNSQNTVKLFTKYITISIEASESAFNHLLSAGFLFNSNLGT